MSETSWLIVFGEKAALRCLWSEDNRCSELVFNSIEDLKNHLLNIHWNPSAGGFPICGVQGCGLLLEDSSSFRRHLLFHVYHAAKQLKGWLHFCKDLENDQIPTSWKIGHCSGYDPLYFKNGPQTKVTYEGEPLICRWNECQTQFDDVQEFFVHSRAHIEYLDKNDRIFSKGQNSMVYVCHWDTCRRTLRDKTSLKDHVIRHIEEKEAACPFCGIFFASNYKLRWHLLRSINITDLAEDQPSTASPSASISTSDTPQPDSSTPTVYKCHLCQKLLPTEGLLRDHSRRHVKKHKCQFCDFTVESVAELRTHIQYRHTDMRPFICRICGKGFCFEYELRRHSAVHKDQPSYQCEICKKTFKWKRWLKNHARTHLRTNKNLTEATATALHICHLCTDKRYTCGASLSLHLTSVHGFTLPPGHIRFQYKKCDDGFFRLQLERHDSVKIAEEMMSIQDSDELQSEQSHSEGLENI